MADLPKEAATTAQPQAVPFTPRNLVVLSDGTGNSAAKLFRTNVWRIYEALDLKADDQVALYDDGVGTASFKPIAVLGGAFGYGLKRNVLELYTFLCRNYKVAPGFEETPDDPATHDKIFAFGFSRGAFTARVVAGLVANQGLICKATNDRDLMRLAKWAYRDYRADRYRNSVGVRLLRMLRNGLFQAKDALLRNKPYQRSKNRKVDIDFLGVFDTVAAYGLPVDELTRGWDKWVWPMLPRDNSLHERVRYARHAVAIDDERQTFFPLLWDEDSAAEKAKKETFKHPGNRIKQVWFAGMHSNVGGGYADDALSLGPLCWMAEEAAAHGLRFQPHRLPPVDPAAPDAPDSKVPTEWRERAAPCAPMGDSRKGVAAYYRYHPRPIGRLCGFKDHSTAPNPDARVTIDLPKIHESVFERIRDARDSYAPFGLPEKYAIVTRQGEVRVGDGDPANPKAPRANPFEHSTQAASRVRDQQRAWDAVWLRRVVYFATIASTVFLLALPLLPLPVVEAADASPNLKMIIGSIGGFLPGFAHGFLDSYQDRPGWLVIAAALVGTLLWCGSYLKGNINDRMRKVWAARKDLNAERLKELAPEPGGWIYRLRESPAYKSTFRFMSDTLWPNVFGLAIVIILLGALPLRLAYQIASRTDGFCSAAFATPTFESQKIGADGAFFKTTEFWFFPSDICRHSGLELKKGQKYAIQVAIPVDPFKEVAGDRPGQTTLVIDEDKSCRAETNDKERKKSLGGWIDLNYPVRSTAGIGSSPVMAAFLPFRRIWGASWFVPIAAIGTKLPERHYLPDGKAEFTPTRTGPLSLYVNDAAFPLGYDEDGVCRTWNCYYKNNTGGPAKVRITELDEQSTVESLAKLQPYDCPEQLAKPEPQGR